MLGSLPPDSVSRRQSVVALVRQSQPFLLLPFVVLNAWCLWVVVDTLRTPLSIFLAAAILSFILDFPVRLLERWRLPRALAIALVIVTILGLLLVAGLTLVPLVIHQVEMLGQLLPGWISSGVQKLLELRQNPLLQRLPVDVDQLLTNLGNGLSAQLQLLSTRVLDLLVTTANGIFQTLLTLIFTFYLLLQGESFWDSIFRWLPRRRRERVRQAFSLSFRNYLTSQITLASLIGSGVTLTLLLLGVEFWLLFGLGVGLLALLPFGGPIGIAIISAILGLSNGWEGLRTLVACLLVDQAIENVLAPRLFGQLTGVHPVWILLSILLGAQLGGVLGVVLAVPTAGFIRLMLQEAPAPAPVREVAP